MLMKNKKVLKEYSPHVYSVNFRQACPHDIEGREQICGLLFIRGDDGRREIYVNECCSGWESAAAIMMALDNLPNSILHDMHRYYMPKYKALTGNNISTFNDDETARRVTFCLLKEILWAHGENVKSIFYGK